MTAPCPAAPCPAAPFPAAPAPRSGRAGFTLLEVMVVLVIVGLLSVMLASGFGQAMDMRVRLGRYLDGTGQSTLLAQWLRASVQGLYGDETDGPNRFAGSARQIAGLTLAPLDGEAGRPTPFAWAIERDGGSSVLVYRGATGAEMRLTSWPGSAGGFRFLDADGVWHRSWPPDSGRSAQAPVLVELSLGPGAGLVQVLAAPRRSADQSAQAPDAQAPDAQAPDGQAPNGQTPNGQTPGTPPRAPRD